MLGEGVENIGWITEAALSRPLQQRASHKDVSDACRTPAAETRLEDGGCAEGEIVPGDSLSPARNLKAFT